MYSSTDRLHYASEQKQYIIALRFQTVLFMPQFTKKCQHVHQYIIM